MITKKLNNTLNEIIIMKKKQKRHKANIFILTKTKINKQTAINKTN